MGLRHLRGYAALERAGLLSARLVAVCDADPVRAGQAARIFESEVGRSPLMLGGLEAVLAEPQVDAVDLVVPTRHHHDLAGRALSSGRHVLVEKPFGITIRACEQMAEAAARHGMTLAVAENYRRVPSHRALKSAIDAGLIGRPYAVSVHTVHQAEAPESGAGGWFRDRRLVGSHPMLELAVHEADLLRHLFGEVDEVYGRVSTYEAEPEPDRAVGFVSEDAGAALLRFRSGALGQLLVITAGHGGGSGGRLISGQRGLIESRRWEGWEDGVVSLDGQPPVPSSRWVSEWLAGLSGEDRGRLLPPGTWDEANLRVDIHDPLRYGIATELHDFAEAVSSGRRPEVGAEEGTRSVAICLAVLESALENRPVAVEDVLAGRLDRWQASLDRPRLG
jgi:predicted dehydrogenase